MKVLAAIPTRGGSKGVPRKNIKKLGGKPLMAYTTETALKTKKSKNFLLQILNDKKKDIDTTMEKRSWLK